MKKIEAIVKPYKLEDVVAALCSIGVRRVMRFGSANVYGLGIGQDPLYRGSEYVVEFLSREVLVSYVEDEMVH